MKDKHTQFSKHIWKVRRPGARRKKKGTQKMCLRVVWSADCCPIVTKRCLAYVHVERGGLRAPLKDSVRDCVQRVLLMYEHLETPPPTVRHWRWRHRTDCSTPQHSRRRLRGPTTTTRQRHSQPAHSSLHTQPHSRQCDRIPVVITRNCEGMKRVAATVGCSHRRNKVPRCRS